MLFWEHVLSIPPGSFCWAVTVLGTRVDLQSTLSSSEWTRQTQPADGTGCDFTFFWISQPVFLGDISGF